eukprot:CAMPEP_0197301788 /NCGR_PEP_ID=MMETSP0890-20130614/50613_1 /TAXON_ID=44058 ORGANISM="Aureoumbra lagunensis, Strain CCMP1510" /NCGR_SAMPLE_ID=MMETSP0890 /ASSEMBLY_ACC=CAM_ASM_000533 /LENGTH=326 /DNA_ID=CAMNT_0042781181 /DNA_START=1314 /DNA_END=2291 /DNA_ORIENTATION=+
MPVGLTTIGEWAFGECTSLTRLTSPASLTTIGLGAFWNCTSLTQLTLPDSITDICSNAFDGCPNDLTIAITSTDEQAFDKVIAKIPATYRGRVIAFTVTAPQEQYRRALLKELLAETLYSLTSTFKVCYIPLACTSKYFHPEDRYDLQPINHGDNDGISFSNQVFGTALLAGHINSFIFDNHHSKVTAPQEQYRQALLRELLARTLYSLTSTFKVCYRALACTSKYFHPEDRYDLQPKILGVNEGISFSNQVFGTASLAGHINSFFFGYHHSNSEVVELRAKISEVLYQVPLLNDDDALNQFKQSINKVVTAQFPDHADAAIVKIW